MILDEIKKAIRDMESVEDIMAMIEEYGEGLYNLGYVEGEDAGLYKASLSVNEKED